ncbi:imm11 family protein [Leisingera sp. JC1]|uniref:imm11 family protein n=1 Tax=Leisingera sp. JC1 TaxID=1855282 RepID=UPI00112FE421|nr:DUF1629 domain-containing protein [Leisingera sp. JC1]
MEAAVPHQKIWESQLLSSPGNIKSLDFFFPGADLKWRVAFQRRYAYGIEPEINTDEYPAYIFFALRDLSSKKKDNLPDLFMGHQGLVIVSGTMHDLLRTFNMGRTRFHEVPLYEYDQKTLRPRRWYFMHIREDRRTLVAEESTGLEPARTGKVWFPSMAGDHEIALDPETAGELDLWLDRSVSSRVFFSDRLKKAIKSSGLSTRWLGFRPCKIVTV